MDHYIVFVDTMDNIMYQTSWNLKQLLDSENDELISKQLKDLRKATNAFISKWEGSTEYLTNPEVLYKALIDFENWQNNYGENNVGYYFSLKSALDETDSNVKAKINQITDFETKISNDMQFFTMRIAKISKEVQKTFLESKLLSPYKHFLESLFVEAKYLLSEPEEKILNLKSQTSHSNWVKMTSEFLSKEEAIVLDEKTKKKIKKNISEISSQMNSVNKDVRKDSAKAFNKIQSKYAEIAEHEFNSILQDKKINDELRKIDRPDLARHISDDISSEVVDVMIKSVSDNFQISKDYYKLKAKLFSQKKLEYYERNVPYGEFQKEYTFENSVELVKTTFNNLDTEFSEIFNKFLEDGNIDVFPNKGKHSGAFCIHGTINQPTFVLLNHDNKLQDVLTLAHELGHGINNELIKKSQNGLNFGTPLSTAEVASTFMEDFVTDELLKSCDDGTKLSLMMMKLNDDVSTIFRQVACYKFEQELHLQFRKDGYLPKEKIGEIFSKHMKSYMGSYVKKMKGSENWWVYWSHIRSFFYVYSYASGLLISKSLQNQVKSDNSYISKVKIFMSAGTSKSPQDIFMDLGIDISKKDFWQKGIEEIQDLLLETEMLARKLKKI